MMVFGFKFKTQELSSNNLGEVAERLNAVDSKSTLGRPNVGSNPTLSVSIL
jgi:hypothetical protein